MWTPPNPVKKFYYRCEKEFHLDDLITLYDIMDDYAIVLISGKRCDFYLYNSNRTQLVRTIEESLPSQHKTGGQSAQRFERIRDERIGWYVKKIIELMIQFYVKNGLTKIKGLIMAGPSHLKDQILSEDMFKIFQPKLLKILTIPEIDDGSILKVISMATDVLSTDYDDQQLLNKFEEILHDPRKSDLLIFGTNQVVQMFDQGLLAEVYVGTADYEFTNHFVNVNSKTKINIFRSKEFAKKYGDIVGVTYYEAQAEINTEPEPESEPESDTNNTINKTNDVIDI